MHVFIGSYSKHLKHKLLTPSFTPTNGVTGKTTNDMTKQAFVTELNSGISAWRDDHSGYDDHSYNYQPANYPKLN